MGAGKCVNISRQQGSYHRAAGGAWTECITGQACGCEFGPHGGLAELRSMFAWTGVANDNGELTTLHIQLCPPRLTGTSCVNKHMSNIL